MSELKLPDELDKILMLMMKERKNTTANHVLYDGIKSQILSLIESKIPKERTEYGDWSNPHDEHHQDGYNEAIEDFKASLGLK